MIAYDYLRLKHLFVIFLTTLYFFLFLFSRTITKTLLTVSAVIQDLHCEIPMIYIIGIDFSSSCICYFNTETHWQCQWVIFSSSCICYVHTETHWQCQWVICSSSYIRYLHTESHRQCRWVFSSNLPNLSVCTIYESYVDRVCAPDRLYARPFVRPTVACESYVGRVFLYHLHRPQYSHTSDVSIPTSYTVLSIIIRRTCQFLPDTPSTVSTRV